MHVYFVKFKDLSNNLSMCFSRGVENTIMLCKYMRHYSDWKFPKYNVEKYLYFLSLSKMSLIFGSVYLSKTVFSFSCLCSMTAASHFCLPVAITFFRLILNWWWLIRIFITNNVQQLLNMFSNFFLTMYWCLTTGYKWVFRL